MEVIEINVNIIEKPKKNINEDIKITCSSDIVDLKDVQAIRNAIREHLLFIGLDNGNNVRNITLLGIGSACDVIIDTKEIIRTALYSASNKIVLVHNHPSNNLKPSKEDFHLTSVTNEMLKVFNIKLLDHIIVTEKDFMSMNKIQKISQENEIQDISNLSKGLLLEENQRLKQELFELQNKAKIKSGVKVVSAEYVGGYNDTNVYNVEINLNGDREHVTLERNYRDMENPNYKWELYSNINLKENKIEHIIQVVSNNQPTISFDAPSTTYENTSIEEIEMGG